MCVFVCVSMCACVYAICACVCMNIYTCECVCACLCIGVTWLTFASEFLELVLSSLYCVMENKHRTSTWIGSSIPYGL